MTPDSPDADNRHTWTGLLIPGSVMACGLLVMLVIGVVAAQHTPWRSFLDCDVFDYRPACDVAAARAVLRGLWLVEAAGLALVLVGVILTWRRLGGGPPRQHERSLRTAVTHAARVGGAALIGTLLAPVLVSATFMSLHAGVAIACAGWLLLGCITVVADRAVGSETPAPRRAWVTGLVAGPIGFTMAAVIVELTNDPGVDNLSLAAAAAGAGVSVFATILLGHGWRRAEQ